MWPIIQDPFEIVILKGKHSETKIICRMKEGTRKYPGRKNKLLNKIIQIYFTIFIFI